MDDDLFYLLQLDEVILYSKKLLIQFGLSVNSRTNGTEQLASLWTSGKTEEIMPKLLLVSISRSLKPNLLLWEEAPLWYGNTSFVFRAFGVWNRSCPRDLLPWFPWADHCCRIATWQNRKWLHFPASCSDWEQAYLLDDTPLFSLLSRGPSILFSFPDLVGCTAVGGGQGRVNCCAQGSKYRVEESGVPSLRGDHFGKDMALNP